MITVYPPIFEDARLQELQKYHILDTAAEQDYEDIVKLASQICRAPIAFISFIDRDRQWFKARLGIDSEEMPRRNTICQYTIQSNDPLVVLDTTLDDRFNYKPSVLRSPKIRFYAGFPLITSQMYRIGTLCVADRAPRNLSKEQRFALEVLARQIVQLLELRHKNSCASLPATEDNYLRVTQDDLAISSRLLSVISHDLSGPIATIKGFFNLLRQKSLSADEINSSIIQISRLIASMEGLMKNLVLWVGMQVRKEADSTTTFSLKKLVEEVSDSVMESNVSKKNTFINEVSDCLVTANRQQVAFIIKSLVHNANKYTRQGSICISNSIKPGKLNISITDSGIGMTHYQVASLFSWKNKLYTLGTEGEKGSGLGLLITHEFVQQMGGSLQVESTRGIGSTFYLNLPCTIKAPYP